MKAETFTGTRGLNISDLPSNYTGAHLTPPSGNTTLPREGFSSTSEPVFSSKSVMNAALDIYEREKAAV